MLHSLQRHQLQYPSEDVVRFLARAKQENAQTFLDVGCGAGRHLKLAQELGYTPTGVDSSPVAVKHAQQAGHTAEVATMTKLPFDDDSFDAVAAWGVLYYATPPELLEALTELHRVTRSWCLANFRTTRDWRCGLGEQLGTHTYRMRMPGEAEDGMTLTFLAAAQLSRLVGYTGVGVELSERTTHQRLRLESDWIVTAQK